MMLTAGVGGACSVRRAEPDATPAARGEMVGGIGVLFAAIATRCNLDPQELYLMGLKMLRDPAQVEGDRGSNGLLQSPIAPAPPAPP
jgi:hypothetical protein